MGGFLGGIGELLGGFNSLRRIKDEGFDFREQQEQRDFERERQRIEAGQADENRGIGLASEAIIGGADPNDPSFQEQAFGPGVDAERRAFLLGTAGGRGAQAKSSLEGQKNTNRYYRDLFQQEGRESLVGLRGDEQRELARLNAELDAGRELSPAEKAKLDTLERMNTARIGAADRRTAAGGSGGGGTPKSMFDTVDQREVTVTPDVLRSAEPGRYISTATGRIQQGEETASGSFEILTRQADAVLRRYEESSIFSPLEKAAAWSQYQSVIGSLGQVLGRSVLRDQRVSQQDREVYTNTIGLTSFVLAELAPEEARKRFDLLLQLSNEAKAGVPYAASTAARQAERIIEKEYGSSAQGGAQRVERGPDGKLRRAQ